MCDKLAPPTQEVAEVHSNKEFTSEDHWQNATNINAASYDCGYCSAHTSSGLGLHSDRNNVFVRICPNCNGPTFFDIRRRQWPGPRVGRPVSGLTEQVQAIYEEARTGTADGAFTGSQVVD